MARELYTPTPPRPAQTQRPDAHWPRFAVLVALLLGAVAAWMYLDPTPSAEGSRPATVVVREGEGWNEATEQLRAKGLVRRPLVFKAIVLISGERGNLMPGRYQIAKGTGSRDIINTLTNPSNPLTLVIPEGWRLGQIREAMVAKKLVTPQEWSSALDSPPESPLLESRPPNAGLDGYVYPGSYSFTDGSNPAAELLREGVASLEEQLTPEIRAGLREQGLSIHQGLTVASIVEREAQVPRERPIIASVYLNRLNQGMRLQADPTTQYAVGEPGDWWKTGLTRTDLRDPSPYNTYVHEGLPPGPICSPGIASIKAVAMPADTDYLYFVARGDGSHEFARTYAEHERNVQRYLRR
ncbi:MAG: endolytic transglycosylase MltG [Chloroflexota bacterium]|nr:endolytic transglycosylase MltG [Chloroflexota bacterium]